MNKKATPAADEVIDRNHPDYKQRFFTVEPEAKDGTMNRVRTFDDSQREADAATHAEILKAAKAGKNAD